MRPPYLFSSHANSRAVPVKYEHVVFCSLSPFQLALYKFFMESPAAKALLKGKDSQPLKAITDRKSVV